MSLQMEAAPPNMQSINISHCKKLFLHFQNIPSRRQLFFAEKSHGFSIRSSRSRLWSFSCRRGNLLPVSFHYVTNASIVSWRPRARQKVRKQKRVSWNVCDVKLTPIGSHFISLKCESYNKNVQDFIFCF